MQDQLSRAKKKLIAVRRAEYRLKQRLEAIDWEFDVLLPEVEQLALNAAKKLELPEFIVEEDED